MFFFAVTGLLFSLIPEKLNWIVPWFIISMMVNLILKLLIG